jgi:NO-binding membrane sensor protein with MHYT domain
VIAVVAATVALSFTVLVRQPRTVLISALVMGIAVCGMHYSGMYALRIRLDPHVPNVSGVQPISFLVPIMIFVILVLVTLVYTMLANPVHSDNEIADQMRTQLYSPESGGDGRGYAPRH